MIYTIEEIKQLKEKRAVTRAKAIAISKKFKIIKKVFFITKSKYQNTMADYTKADREYAFALFDKKQQKLKKIPKTKAYDANKRTATKALKTLESLPKEMRDKIIANAQDGLF